MEYTTEKQCKECEKKDMEIKEMQEWIDTWRELYCFASDSLEKLTEIVKRR